MKTPSKITLWLPLALITVFSGCSNTKNTAATRAFHNVTARYNVIFEAQQSYLRGIENIEKGITPDYTELLPVFITDAAEAPSLSSADMDACVAECGKNILKHSITSKPVRGYSRSGMSGTQQSFFEKPEYCKWIDDTYLLMGKANYVGGDYDRAESSFQLGVTRFKHYPTKFEAQLWLARTFWAEKNYTEAQDLLDKLLADKRHSVKLDADIHKLYATIAISTKRYAQAVEELQKALPLLKKRDKKQRVRLIFILGDLNRIIGNYTESRKCYAEVIKLNPEYSMVFNAKINLATVFTRGENSAVIRRQLNELAKDEKNKEFLDRIYYGIAELDKKDQDFNSALINYRKSARYSFKNNVQKAKSYMEAADIYFNKADYLKAGEFYDSTMQYLPDTYSGYKEIAKTAKNLKELISYIRQADYQDSIQRIAKLDPQERNKVIAAIIDDVIAQEEAAKLANANPYYQSSDNSFGVEYTGQDGNPNFQGKWYLYNVTALNYGRQEFLKKWGNRPLEDNWRRKNKSISHDVDDEEAENDSENEEGEISDRKKPEYYLKNLPLTDSLMDVSINREADAMFNVSTTYSDKIGDLDKAVETLLTLNEKHPNHYLKAQTYYQLYQLYILKGEKQLAEYTKTQMIAEFPESGYTKILSDPDYLKHVAARKQKAGDFYASMLEHFNSQDYNSALKMCEEGQKQYADLDIALNFMYMEARCYGNLNEADKMKEKLIFIKENYPKTETARYAELKLSAFENDKNGVEKFEKDFLCGHHFVIAAEKETEYKPLNFKVLNQCVLSGNSQAEVSEKDFSEKYFLYYVSDFENAEAAKKFLEGFMEKNPEEKERKIFVIGNANFLKLEQDTDIEAYYNFYLNNYVN